MARIVLMTSGPLHAGLSQAVQMEFSQLSDRIFSQFGVDDQSVSFTAGFGQSETVGEWGAWVVPKAHREDADKTLILQTLSVWHNLESMAAFSYHGNHAEALKRRAEWFPDHGKPSHVLYWIADDHQTTWQEAINQYDYLIEHGATPTAFTMKALYSVDGNAIKLNRDNLNEKAKLYK